MSSVSLSIFVRILESITIKYLYFVKKNKLLYHIDIYIIGDIMRFLAWLVGVLVAFAALIFMLLFTPVGNGVLKPLIEAKIKEQTKLQSKLTTFKLSMSQFKIILELNRNSTVLLIGNYSLFSKALNAVYKIKLEELATLQPLISLPLQGRVHTEGRVKGDMAYMEIEGKSDIGEGNTIYHLKLKDLNPISIIAKVKKAKLSSLLYLGGQSRYARADIDLDVNFKNINPGKMDGDILLKTTNATIDSKLMLKDFNVTLPETSFVMNLDATLKGDDVDYNYALSSRLFEITSSGNIVPKPLKADIKYSLDISELALLKAVTGTDIRGALKVEGTAKGTKEKLELRGKSDLCESDTKFEALLKEFTLKSVKATVRDLNLSKALYMAKQTHYADGVFSMDADISDARADNLRGSIVTKIRDGVLDSNYLTKAYKFSSTMPRTTFGLSAATMLSGDTLDTKLDLNSNLADLDIKKAVFDIKERSLNSDYRVEIKDLDKLFFATAQHLKGSLRVNGELSYVKDLDLTMHSKVANGKIDAKLHNDELHAELNGIETIELLHMLSYPELFKSTLNAKLDYNLAQNKGVFSGNAADGSFVRNKTFDLIKQYVKFDMYKERFNGDIDAEINRENVLASFDLRSNRASIKTADAKLNTKTRKIDSDITIQAKKNTITANLKGDINAPKVTIDLEKFMKSEAGKKIMDKVNKKINKLFKKFF